MISQIRYFYFSHDKNKGLFDGWSRAYLLTILSALPSDRKPAILAREAWRGNDTWLRFEDVLLFPMVNAMTDTFSSVEETRWIRRQAYRFCNASAPRAPRFVTLLSRRGARRQLVNEEEIVAVLRAAGFEAQLQNFAGKSFCEQVRVMQATRVVVSNHGAQLANLLFLQPGSAVIELFNPFFVLDMYQRMARRAEVRYLAFTNATIVNLPSEASRRWWFHPYAHCDVAMDAATLLRAVRSFSKSGELAV